MDFLFDDLAEGLTCPEAVAVDDQAAPYRASAPAAAASSRAR